ncbi:MAG: AgmX/PglI C-terminal domain-containing protein, partial [Myxococcales bacterium]|nr:AgmX/PglI C-terminal domain-containing protein [Myxococcales bacterium]
TATTRGSGISGSSRSSSGSGSSGGGSSSGGSGGGVNPFGNYTPPGKDPVNGGQTQPAGGGPTQPAGGGQPAPAPAPGEQTPPTDGQAQPAQPPAEEPKPAEEAKPPEPELTKSKMTPAIRDAIVGKVGAAQQCYTDALVGKPDLAGRVMFTVSLDQDGVVTKVDIIKDEVKYGVAKCVAKKIRTWTLPSAGIPIIFDLPPFDFKP